MTAAGVLALTAPLRRRRTAAWVGTGVLLALVTVGTLTSGDADIPPLDAVLALLGIGDPGTVLVVQQWRLPRALLGLGVGALLGLSGAVFQVVTRNALGSPDVLGFSAGAFTGVLLVMGGGAVSVAALTGAALLGGLGAAVLVFGLGARSGAAGSALVITGIGVTALLAAVNTVLIIRSDQVVARAAAVWASGSLNGVDARWIAPTAAALVLGGLGAAWLAPALALHELGDERAGTLAGRPVLTRWTAMVLGVALLAVATAVTGPIAFVALAAPQVARRLWRTGVLPLTASAATGALLLCSSDLVAARLLAPTVLPTGLVTSCLGGVYLAWLLTAGLRRRS